MLSKGVGEAVENSPVEKSRSNTWKKKFKNEVGFLWTTATETTKRNTA